MNQENCIFSPKKHIKKTQCLILGVGNILWADEGFGVRAVERFNERYKVLNDDVCIEDGGTLGMYLLEPICDARRLLILDCADFHGKGGEMRILRNEDVRAWSSTKISPHQTGMNDILAAATIRDCYPEEIAVIGMQPIILDDYGGSLSPEIKNQLDAAADYAADILREWGIRVEKRSADDKAPALSPAAALELETYEKMRPGENDVCRVGDARFLNDAVKKYLAENA